MNYQYPFGAGSELGLAAVDNDLPMRYRLLHVLHHLFLLLHQLRIAQLHPVDFASHRLRPDINASVETANKNIRSGMADTIYDLAYG